MYKKCGYCNKRSTPASEDVSLELPERLIVLLHVPIYACNECNHFICSDAIQDLYNTCGDALVAYCDETKNDRPRYEDFVRYFERRHLR